MENTVKTYGVKYLVHFTKVENLQSIFANGILPVSELLSRKIEYNWNDEYRIDGYPTASCFSIGFPNYRMFYPTRNRYPHAEWAVLGIKREVLWEKECAFCKENAAHSNELSLSLTERKGVSGFHRMFEEYEGKPSRSEMRIPPYLPTNPQAEVLLFDKVELSYIIGVAFENKETKEKHHHLIPKDLKVFIQKDYFYPRNDHEFWRTD